MLSFTVYFDRAPQPVTADAAGRITTLDGTLLVGDYRVGKSGARRQGPVFVNAAGTGINRTPAPAEIGVKAYVELSCVIGTKAAEAPAAPKALPGTQAAYPVGATVYRMEPYDSRAGVVLEHLEDGRLLVSWPSDKMTQGGRVRTRVAPDPARFTLDEAAAVAYHSAPRGKWGRSARGVDPRR